MSPLTIKTFILAAGVILMATGFTFNHFRVGNKDVRYIVTVIGVGITMFALVHLSTDIGTAFFDTKGVNARMQKPNP